jgi:hypothetical protein
MRALLHGRDFRPAGHVLAVAEVDVSRAAEGREAEPDATDRQAGPAERVKARLLR